MAKKKNNGHQSPDKIDITYHGELEDLTIQPCNGAWGGIDPYAELVVAHLVFELLAMPTAATLDLDENGLPIKNSEEFVRHSDIQRSYIGSYTFTAQSARRVGEWLIDKATRLENIRSGKK